MATHTSPNDPITLIGPGGAGKTTTGRLIADRIGATFFDLDECFLQQTGNITEWIHKHGYAAYARQNVVNYLDLAPRVDAVLALSSGFMTYDADIHPRYREVRAAIAAGPLTYVLLPSPTKPLAVVETVRRQLQRSIPVESVERETEKARRRYDVYSAIGAPIVYTDTQPDRVAGMIIGLAGSRQTHP